VISQHSTKRSTKEKKMTNQGIRTPGLDNPGINHAIAELPDGWASVLQCAFDIAPDNAERRRAARRALLALVAAGVIERDFCRHRDRLLELVRIDGEAIAAALGGAR
jgi:hypothetical protein